MATRRIASRSFIAPLCTALALIAATTLPSHTATAQPYPIPYMTVENWAQLPAGRTMGAVGDTDVDIDGTSIWAIIRCDATAPDRFGDECVDSDLDSILKFDANGNVGPLINADANVVAAYTYDPFGNVTEMAGAEAAENPWRFSTKPIEAGTGWLYYGYRWYDAEN
jgi:hypothetical protein